MANHNNACAVHDAVELGTAPNTITRAAPCRGLAARAGISSPGEPGTEHGDLALEAFSLSDPSNVMVDQS